MESDNSDDITTEECSASDVNYKPRFGLIPPFGHLSTLFGKKSGWIQTIDNSTLRNFACGFGAAAVETVAVHPLTKLVFRQKLHNIYADQAAKQLVEEGFRHLYRGVLPRLLQKAPTKAIMFGVYDYLCEFANCGSVSSFHFCHASAAFLAGIAEGVLTPLERIQTLMQTEKYHCSFKNSLHAFQEIRSYGISEYYRGTVITVLRNGTGNGVFFGLREPLQTFIRRSDEYKNYRPAVAEFSGRFLSGAVLGTFIAFMNFPLNVIRVRCQSQLGGEFHTSFAVLKQLMKERNYRVKFVYRGVHLTCAKSFFSWGITNSIYEFLKTLLTSN